jgi:hypothetical protein
MTTTTTAPAKTYQWRDPVPLAQVLTYFLMADIGARVLDAAVVFLTPSGGKDGGAGMSLDNLVGILTLISAAATFIIFFSAAFLSLKWCYRVQMNAHSMASGFSTTPPWAVGWFFVPIMNLFKPFQAVQEAWKAARSPSAWAAVQLPATLGWWWAAWIVSNIVSNLSFRLSMADGDMGQAANVVALLSDALTAASDVLFIQVVTGLSNDQRHALEGDTFA